MTRDEAIKIVTLSNPTPYPRAFVQALEALGVLKLNENDSDAGECGGRTGKVRNFMRNFHLQNFSPVQLESALHTAGLKIIEK